MYVGKLKDRAASAKIGLEKADRAFLGFCNIFNNGRIAKSPLTDSIYPGTRAALFDSITEIAVSSNSFPHADTIMLSANEISKMKTYFEKAYRIGAENPQELITKLECLKQEFARFKTAVSSACTEIAKSQI